MLTCARYEIHRTQTDTPIRTTSYVIFSHFSNSEDFYIKQMFNKIAIERCRIRVVLLST